MMSRSTKIVLGAFVGLVGCIVVESEPNSNSSDMCWVAFDDSYNMFNSIIDVDSHERDGAQSFIVLDEDKDETIHAHFDGRGSSLETNANVPNSTLDEIRGRYESEVETFATTGEVVIGTQLTYTLLPGAACSKDEIALILFLVDEWLYFG